jgi:hypothetical protein
MKLSVIVSFYLVTSAAPFVVAAAPLYFTESFEQGSAFGPAPGYSPSTLAGVVTAPNSSPALHINQGGDIELMYSPASFTHVAAFATGNYGDVQIDGYVGIGSAGSSGGISGGLILRATDPDDYYSAYINTNPGNPRQGDLLLTESVGGINNYPFSHLSIPNFDPLQEDYHITFAANGSILTASISRENVVNGIVVETALGSISTVDSSFASGEVGLYSFAANSNNVFFDDITVSAVPEPTSGLLIGLGIMLFAFGPIGRRFLISKESAAPLLISHNRPGVDAGGAICLRIRGQWPSATQAGR